MPENKLSVCVTTYNDGESIAACLADLADLKEVAGELIVADAGSSDGTLAAGSHKRRAHASIKWSSHAASVR